MSKIPYESGNALWNKSMTPTLLVKYDESDQELVWVPVL